MIEVSTSRLVAWFLLCFLAGVFISSFFWFGQTLFSLLLFLAIGLVVVSFFVGKKEISIFGFLVLVFVFGVWRFQTINLGLQRPDLDKFYNQRVRVIGYVVDDPEIGVERIKTKVWVRGLKANLLLISELYPQLRYGDKLRIEGKLKEPPVFEGFNYKEFLQKRRIYFLVSYPKIEILDRNQGSWVKTTLFSFKNKMKQSLEKIVPFYQAGFFEALLWGEENNISDQWKERLNLTGTRHVAAVSGMNITIISSLVLNFFLGLGLWRNHSFWLSLFLIFLYVLMIGAPASGVRAGIMAGLFLFSQYSGRLVDGQRLVLLAAGLMVLLNPLLLRFDIGFQLSFLAILGLIYLGPLFSRWFKKIPNVLGLRMNLCSTLAAQVFVLPILLYNFGQLSLISPLVNVLILPFIPLLTILGFVFSFLGIFSQTLGWLISLPGQLVLEIMMRIIEFFSSFSWAAVQIRLSGWFVLATYLGLFVLVYFLKRKQRLSFLDYSFY